MSTMKPAAPLLLCLTLMILGVAPPMTGAPSVASPLLLRLSQRHLRRMSPSPLTTRVSLLKLAADVVKYTDVDYATGSFCSSCSIPPLTAGGLWSTCDYDYEGSL